jgi:hypothetical protein
VYGRRPDYDPRRDSTVRSEVARLRARLSLYYSTEGRQDELMIELPKGSYVPAFRQSEPTPGTQRVSSRRYRLAACLARFRTNSRSSWQRPRSLIRKGKAIYNTPWFMRE